jgi:hypothetical protein
MGHVAFCRVGKVGNADLNGKRPQYVIIECEGWHVDEKL